MATPNPVPRLYRTVVEDVIGNVREAFLDEGVDEQVLQELKQLWESKLQQSRALDTPPEHQEQVVAFQYTQMIPQAQPSQIKQQYIGATGVVTQNVPVPVQIAASQDISQPAAAAHMALPQGVFQQQLQALASQGLTLQPTGNGQFIIQQLPPQVPGQMGAPQLQQVTLTQSNIPTMIQSQPQQQQKPHGVLQLDGAGDSSSSEDEDFDDDDDDNENDEDKNEDNEDDQGEEEEPLNSDDDVSDEDPSDLFDTDNVVVCQYDKIVAYVGKGPSHTVDGKGVKFVLRLWVPQVPWNSFSVGAEALINTLGAHIQNNKINRNKNKWKFHLKDGIMNLNGKDFVFQKATGDAEW